MRDDSSRLFLCQRCRDQVYICSFCDRGNRYCRSCAPLARAESLRSAGRRYQKTRRGACLHALRQQAYRERQAQKVTHHGSPRTHVPATVEPLPADTSEASPSFREPYRCRWCGNPGRHFARRGFLHHRSGQRRGIPGRKEPP